MGRDVALLRRSRCHGAHVASRSRGLEVQGTVAGHMGWGQWGAGMPAAGWSGGEDRGGSMGSYDAGGAQFSVLKRHLLGWGLDRDDAEHSALQRCFLTCRQG